MFQRTVNNAKMTLRKPSSMTTSGSLRLANFATSEHLEAC